MPVPNNVLLLTSVNNLYDCTAGVMYIHGMQDIGFCYSYLVSHENYLPGKKKTFIKFPLTGTKCFTDFGTSLAITCIYKCR